MRHFNYIHLHNHFTGSFSDSILKIKDAVERIKKYGHSGIGIADHGNLAAIWPFYFHCIEQNIIPVIGCEIYFDVSSDGNGPRTHLVVIAKNLKGFFNLINMNNEAWEKNYQPPKYGVVNWKLLKKYRQGLIVLSACIGGPVGHHIRNGNLREAERVFKHLNDLFKDDFYPELAGHNLVDQKPVNRTLIRFSKKYGRKPVVTNDCHYIDRDDWFTHQVFMRTAEKYPSDFSYSARCFYLKSNQSMSRMRFPEQYLNTTMEILGKVTLHTELDNYLKHIQTYKKNPTAFRCLPIARPMIVDPAMAMIDAMNVIKRSDKMLKPYLEILRSAGTLTECYQQNRKFRTFAQSNSKVFKQALAIEGLTRMHLPDYSQMVEINELNKSLIPFRRVYGELIADVTDETLNRLNVKTISSDTNYDLQYFGNAISDWRRDNYKSARKSLEMMKTHFADSHYLLADCMYHMGDYDCAMEHLKLGNKLHYYFRSFKQRANYQIRKLELLKQLGIRPDKNHNQIYRELFHRIKPCILTHILRVMLTKPVGYIPGPRQMLWTLMFADISGFTALSEELSKNKNGSEILTRLINRLFTRMIDIIEKHGGSILKFGGDALLVMFPETGNNENIARISAVKTGNALLKYIDSEGQVTIAGKQHKLRISIGIHYGRIFSTMLGRNLQVQEYFISGPVLNQLMRAEGYANPGEIVITTPVLNAIPTLRTKSINSRYHRIVKTGNLGTNKLPRIFPAKSPRLPAEKYETLVPMMISQLPEQLVKKYAALGSDEEFFNEHHKVTSLFINLTGISNMVAEGKISFNEGLHKIIEIYFNRLLTIVNKYGGTVGRTDIFHRGEKIFIYFGALSYYENDADRAVRCALELNASLTDINHQIKKQNILQCQIRQKIGINTGTAFCGMVGSRSRKEYTVMGKSVNIAARLMEKAPINGICIGNTTRYELGDYYDLIQKRSYLKGIKQIYTYYQVRGFKSEKRVYLRKERGQGEVVNKLIGRESEISLVRHLLSRADHGRFSWLNIIGEPGIGKSTLVNEIIEFAQLCDFRVLNTECLYHSAAIPYYIWNHIMKTIFQMIGNGDMKKGYYKLKKIYPNELLPLAAELAGLIVKDTTATAGLSGEGRKQAIFKIIPQVLHKFSQLQPTLLVIEDIHWMDENSRELLKSLTSGTDRNNPMLIISTSRPQKDFKLVSNKCYKTLIIRELTKRETEKLIRSFSVSKKFSKQNIEDIYVKTAGNPFFVSEIIQTMKETISQHQSLQTLRISDKIQSVLVSRMDRLTEKCRMLLLLASVAGRTFDVEMIKDLYPGDSSSIDSMLKELCSRNFIFSHGQEKQDVFTFRHDLTRDAAYNCLADSLKEKLHSQIGKWIEKRFKSTISEKYELLAYHFTRSNDQVKSIKYLTLAGNKARTAFANKQAIEFYSDAIRKIDGKTDGYYQSKLIDLYCYRGLTLRLIGQYSRAIADFEFMADLAGSRHDTKTRAMALNYIGSAYRWQGDQRKALKYCGDALKTALRLRNKRFAATCYNSIAVVYWYLGDYRNAIDNGEKSLTIRRKSGNPTEISRGLFSLGNSYTKICDFISAKRCFTELLKASLYSKDKIGIAYAYDGLGYCELKAGRFSRALQYHEKSYQIRLQTGDLRGIVYSYIDFGDVKYFCGDYKSAQKYYQQASETVDQIEDENLRSDVQRCLGLCVLKSKKYSDAKQYLNKSLDIAKRIKFHESLVKTYNAMSEFMITINCLTDAKKYNNKVSKLAYASGMIDFYISSRINDAIIRYHKHQTEAALKILAEVFEQAHSISMPLLELRIAIVMKNCYRIIDDDRGFKWAEGLIRRFSGFITRNISTEAERKKFQVWLLEEEKRIAY